MCPAPDVHEPWTIGRLLSWTSDFLSKNGVDEPRLAAEVLLAGAVPCRRIDLYARHASVLDEPTLAKFRDWVRRAAKHEPIAYLVGEKEFFSLRFAVNPAVLIPRPETETLVEWALDHTRSASLETPVILDIGTGSGCIAIALLANLPGATAIATDVSAAALEVARQNADRHKVTERLSLIEARGLLLPSDVMPAGGFDLIVSNPPYIPAGEVQALEANVRDFEPRSALTDEADGLSVYREIGQRAAALMATTGRVLVEVADGGAGDARQATTAAGRLEYVSTRKDRITGAERALMFKRANND
jgi:release factor glutamine methyltransferase